MCLRVRGRDREDPQVASDRFHHARDYPRTIVTRDNVINVSSNNYIYVYCYVTDLETITHGLSMWCLRYKQEYIFS